MNPLAADLFAAACSHDLLTGCNHHISSAKALIYGIIETLGEPKSDWGQVVAISLPTSQSFHAAVIAVWASGRLGAPIGTRTNIREVQRSLAETKPMWVIRASDDTRFAEQERQTILLPHYEPKIAMAQTNIGTAHTLIGLNDAWMATTSGSTGEPKFAVLTYANIRHNAQAVAGIQNLTPKDSVMAFTPSNFAYALNQLTTTLLAGARLYSWSHGLTAPASLLDEMAVNNISVFSANPTAFKILLRAGRGRKLSSVRQIMSGGQPLHSELVSRMADLFPNAQVISGYGCTEYVNRVAYRPVLPSDLTHGQVLSVGHAIDSTNIELRSWHDAADPEIVISGPSLMRGYLEDLTSVSSHIGEFLTGDLGHFDTDRSLVLTGRRKTVINVANEMVSPEELEAVAKGVAGVSECAVAGVADPLLGEVPRALVVVDDAFDAEAVLRALKSEWRDKLSHIKRPAGIHAVPHEAIPRIENGKIDRRALASAILRY